MKSEGGDSLDQTGVCSYVARKKERKKKEIFVPKCASLNSTLITRTPASREAFLFFFRFNVAILNSTYCRARRRQVRKKANTL